MKRLRINKMNSSVNASTSEPSHNMRVFAQIDDEFLPVDSQITCLRLPNEALEDLTEDDQDILYESGIVRGEDSDGFVFLDVSSRVLSASADVKDVIDLLSKDPSAEKVELVEVYR